MDKAAAATWPVPVAEILPAVVVPDRKLPTTPEPAAIEVPLVALFASVAGTFPAAFVPKYMTGFVAEFAGVAPNTEVAVCPAAVEGADEILAATTVVSSAVPAPDRLIVIGIVTDSPTRAVGIVPTVMLEIVAALADATPVRTPNPNAATVTSAMRLKVVFVDICFLSISRSREFPSFGLKLIF
jgi:hypothetical protein